MAYASRETVFGIENSPYKINSCSYSRFGALKGTVPVSIAYKSTPKDQMSTKNPSYPVSLIISGAK